MPPSKGRGRSPCSPKGIVDWTCVALDDVQDPSNFLLVIVEDVMAIVGIWRTSPAFARVLIILAILACATVTGIGLIT